MFTRTIKFYFVSVKIENTTISAVAVFYNFQK